MIYYPIIIRKNMILKLKCEYFLETITIWKIASAILEQFFGIVYHSELRQADSLP